MNRLHPRRVYTQFLRPRLARGIESYGASRLLGGEELRQADASEVCRTIEYGDDERYRFEEPTVRGRVPAELRDKYGTFVVPRPFVASLSDVALVGPHALPVTSTGRYVTENTEGGANRLIDALLLAALQGNLPFRSRYRAPERTFEGSVCSLVGPWCREYFHWFVDYLPRIRGVEAYAARTGETVHLLVPESAEGWMRSSLRLMGYPHEECLHWDGGRAVAENLVVPSLPRGWPRSDGRGYIQSSEALRWVGDRIRRRLGVGRSDAPSRRVYVSRREADTRRVVNEPSVVDRLTELGFERRVLTDVEFEEQVRLFADAEAVVGPHGAGLVNTVYAASPTVVEMFGSYVNACYYTLFTGLGFDYGVVTADPVGDDMRVNVGALESCLRELGIDDGA